MIGGSNAAAWWGARVAALALVAVAASLLWRNTIGLQRGGDDRPIWIEPGEYKGPPDAALDPAQVEAVNARAQRLNY
jgi:hypothetical protein